MTAASQPERTADIRTLAKYADLEQERERIADALKRVEAKIAELEEPVLDYFRRTGMQSTKINGRTLYLRRDVYAGRAQGVDSETACNALEAAGFGEFVKRGVVTQSLRGLLIERERSGEEAVPPSLAGIIEAKEVYRVGSRRA